MYIQFIFLTNLTFKSNMLILLDVELHETFEISDKNFIFTKVLKMYINDCAYLDKFL